MIGIVDGNDAGYRHATGVANADVPPRNQTLALDLGHQPFQRQSGGSRFERDNLNIGKSHAIAPSGAKRLHDGFLHSKASCQSLSTVYSITCCGKFRRGKVSIEKGLSGITEEAAELSDIDHINAMANDHAAVRFDREGVVARGATA